MCLALLVKNEKAPRKGSLLAMSSSQAPVLGTKLVHKGLKFKMGWIKF